MRSTYHKSNSQIVVTTFAHQGDSKIGFLTCYLDWVEEYFTQVRGWEISRIFPQPNSESFIYYTEGLLKLCISEYKEFSNQDYIPTKRYLETITHSVSGSALPYCSFPEIRLDSKNEIYIGTILKILVEENRLELTTAEIAKSWINTNPTFQRCLALAIQSNSKDLMSSIHNYQEIGAKFKHG